MNNQRKQAYHKRHRRNFIQTHLMQSFLNSLWQQLSVYPCTHSSLNSSRWLNTVTVDETGLMSQLISTPSLPTQPLQYTPTTFSLWTAVWVLLRPTRIRTVKELWDGGLRLQNLVACNGYEKWRHNRHESKKSKPFLKQKIKKKNHILSSTKKRVSFKTFYDTKAV